MSDLDITNDTTTTDTTTTTTDTATTTAESGNGDWSKFVDSLDPEIKADPALKAVSDLKSLAKSYVHAQRKIGADKVIVPGKNADEKEWGDFFSKIGRPDSADKYGIGELEVAKEFDDEDSKKFLQEFQETALKNNLLPSQAKNMFEWWLSKETEASKDMESKTNTDREKAVLDLKNEWGAEFDSKIEKAKVALRQFASDDVIKQVRDRGLGSDPLILRIFSEIGHNLSEDVFKGHAVSNLGMTKDEAKAAVSDAFANPEGPYLNAAHPRHADEVARISRLMQITS